jgi:hypothetical protein
MGNYLNVGNAGFETVRKKTYVDKTGMIAVINSTLGTMYKLTCVSRPRRFGKSFAAQMLCAYYDKSCDSRALFEDLEIAADPSFETYLNKYDVIYLDVTWFISITNDIKNIVVNLQEKVMEAIENEEIANYWTRTETYESLKVYIDMDFDGLKEMIVQMLGGAHCPVQTIGFQNDMTSINNRDEVLTLLVHLGYLAYNADEKTVHIPNEEIRQEFIYAVENGCHKEVAKLIKTSDLLLRATLRMDAEAVAAAIEEAHSAGTAPLFYNDEQALRSVIRFAYISCVDKFLRIEELPTGIGYADVVYLPKKGSTMPIMVVELKINKSAEGAIAQIKNRNYPQSLEGFGSDILLVGVNYDEKSKKHTCVIEKYVKASRLFKIQFLLPNVFLLDTFPQCKPVRSTIILKTHHKALQPFSMQ